MYNHILRPPSLAIWPDAHIVVFDNLHRLHGYLWKESMTTRKAVKNKAYLNLSHCMHSKTISGAFNPCADS